jgi:hypothetical protein
MGTHTTERKQVMRAVAQARVLADGLEKHGDLLKGLRVRGKKMTVKQVRARLEPILVAADKADAAKLALKKELAARDAAIAAERSSLADFGAAILGSLGHGHPHLVSFGLPSGKRRKRTQAEEAVSAALRRQTRKVRGTMGPKQRAAVTLAGTPGLLVVDPTGKVIPGLGLPPIPPGRKPQK